MAIKSKEDLCKRWMLYIKNKIRATSPKNMLEALYDEEEGEDRDETPQRTRLRIMRSETAHFTYLPHSYSTIRDMETIIKGNSL